MVGVAVGYEPWASSPAVRLVMQGNRKRDTRPEIALRRALHARGFRYRVELRAAGWTALRIWEHEPAASGADRVAATLDLLQDGA